MNQTQRDYLIKTVETECNTQIRALQAQIPDSPSLNNYLVAAFLDNSIKFNDIEVLRTKIRKSVLKMGKGEVLVEHDRHWNSSNKDANLVKVIAEDLFIIPENYKEALKEYQLKKAQIDAKIKQLEASKNTIVMKIQIGSSATMDKIVMQVDNMGDLNLLNSQLVIGDGSK